MMHVAQRLTKTDSNSNKIAIKINRVWILCLTIFWGLLQNGKIVIFFDHNFNLLFSILIEKSINYSVSIIFLSLSLSWCCMQNIVFGTNSPNTGTGDTCPVGQERSLHYHRSCPGGYSGHTSDIHRCQCRGRNRWHADTQVSHSPLIQTTEKRNEMYLHFIKFTTYVFSNPQQKLHVIKKILGSRKSDVECTDKSLSTTGSSLNHWSYRPYQK